MNAIRHPRAIAALTQHATTPDPLADRRAAMQRQMVEQDGIRIESNGASLHIRPGCTREERLALAQFLAAGTGARIVEE